MGYEQFSKHLTAIFGRELFEGGSGRKARLARSPSIGTRALGFAEPASKGGLRTRRRPRPVQRVHRRPRSLQRSPVSANNDGPGPLVIFQVEALTCTVTPSKVVVVRAVTSQSTT